MAIGDSKRNKREIATQGRVNLCRAETGVEEWLWMTRNEKR